MSILLLVSLVVLKKKLEPRLLYIDPKTWILLVPWHYCRKKKWKCLVRSTNSKLRIRSLANLVAGVSLPVTKPNLLTRKKMWRKEIEHQPKKSGQRSRLPERLMTCAIPVERNGLGEITNALIRFPFIWFKSLWKCFSWMTARMVRRIALTKLMKLSWLWKKINLIRQSKKEKKNLI